jgi:MerR family redox-sensitive transcriptional activator SoxR
MPDTSSPIRLTIGQLAERAGLATSAIRYYESVGVLPVPQRDASGRRRYDEHATLRRLAIIDIAQRAGLTLGDIRELTGSDPGTTTSERLHEIAARRLPEIEALIERAQHVHAWLSAATYCECETIDDCGLFREAADVHGARAAVSARRG